MKTTSQTQGMMLAVACLLFPTASALTADEPHGQAGEVESVEKLVLRDSARGKDIPLYVTFPRGEGKLPVIVQDHAAGIERSNWTTAAPARVHRLVRRVSAAKPVGLRQLADARHRPRWQ